MKRKRNEEKTKEDNAEVETDSLFVTVKVETQKYLS